jgi:hypothetical protein
MWLTLGRGPTGFRPAPGRAPPQRRKAKSSCRTRLVHELIESDPPRLGDSRAPNRFHREPGNTSMSRLNLIRQRSIRFDPTALTRSPCPRSHGPLRGSRVRANSTRVGQKPGTERRRIRTTCLILIRQRSELALLGGRDQKPLVRHLDDPGLVGNVHIAFQGGPPPGASSVASPLAREARRSETSPLSAPRGFVDQRYRDPRAGASGRMHGRDHAPVDAVLAALRLLLVRARQAPPPYVPPPRTNSVASPIPPEMHNVASPRRPPRRASSWISVTAIRAPVHPIG